MTEIKILQLPAQKILRDKGILYYHIQKTSKPKYDTNKDMKGNPDLCIALPTGKTWYVEFKTESGVLKKEQSEKLNYLWESGHDVDIIMDIKNFENKLMGRLNLND